MDKLIPAYWTWDKDSRRFMSQKKNEVTGLFMAHKQLSAKIIDRVMIKVHDFALRCLRYHRTVCWNCSWAAQCAHRAAVHWLTHSLQSLATLSAGNKSTRFLRDAVTHLRHLSPVSISTPIAVRVFVVESSRENGTVIGNFIVVKFFFKQRAIVWYTT